MKNAEETIKWFELFRLIVHKASETALSINGLVANIDRICDEVIKECQQQSSYSNRDILEEEIKVSLTQGFKVIVLNDYIEVECLRTGVSEWKSITDYVETSTKLRLINRMKDNLIKLGGLLRKPLPNNSIT